MKVICDHYDICSNNTCMHLIEHNCYSKCRDKCSTRHPDSKCIDMDSISIIDVDELFEEIDI